MSYLPTTKELARLLDRGSPEVRSVLSGTPRRVSEPEPITDPSKARKYLYAKIEKYKGKGRAERLLEKYVESAKVCLEGPNKTYANLYSRSHSFLENPTIAVALAYNMLEQIAPVPDEIDLKFGLTYK